MNRLLTFGPYQEVIDNKVRLGATHYIEAEYVMVAVRIYAGSAPNAQAKVDIYNGGVSIFNNRTSPNQYTGVAGDSVTYAVLGGGENVADYNDDFTNDVIMVGSVIYCILEDTGGGRNFTVTLELEEITG